MENYENYRLIISVSVLCRILLAIIFPSLDSLSPKDEGTYEHCTVHEKLSHDDHMLHCLQVIRHQRKAGQYGK